MLLTGDRLNGFGAEDIFISAQRLFLLPPCHVFISWLQSCQEQDAHSFSPEYGSPEGAADKRVIQTEVAVRR